jgi:hypothetical protein
MTAARRNLSDTYRNMKEQDPAPALEPHLLRQIAVEAEVDPKTVARVLAGQPTRALQRRHIVEAVRKLGLERFLPAEEVSR